MKKSELRRCIHKLTALILSMAMVLSLASTAFAKNLSPSASEVPDASTPVEVIEDVTEDKSTEEEFETEIPVEDSISTEAQEVDSAETVEDFTEAAESAEATEDTTATESIAEDTEEADNAEEEPVDTVPVAPDDKKDSTDTSIELMGGTVSDEKLIEYIRVNGIYGDELSYPWASDWMPFREWAHNKGYDTMTLAQWVSKNNASSWITPNTKKGTGLANHLLLEQLINYEYFKETKSAADFADVDKVNYIHESMTKTEMAKSATTIVADIPHKYGFDCASHSMELIFMMKSLGIPAYQRNDRTYNWSSGYNHQNVVCFPEGTNDTDQFYLAEADGVFEFSKIGAWDFYTGKDKEDQTPGTAMITRYNGVKTRNLVVPKTVKDNRNEEFTVTELGQYIDLAGDEVVSELLSNVTDPDAVRCESLQMPDTVKYLHRDFFGNYVNPDKTISVTGMTGLKGAYIYQFGAKIDQVNFFTTSTTDKYVNLIPKEFGQPNAHATVGTGLIGAVKYEDGNKIAGYVSNSLVDSERANTYFYFPEGLEKMRGEMSASDHLHARSPSDSDYGIYIPASVTEINEHAFYNTKVIYGIAGSYAEKWAKEIALSPTLPIDDPDYDRYSTWKQTPKKFIPVENVKVNYDDYSRTWDIVKIDISTCTVTANPTSFTYNGSAQKPAITAKDGSETLKEGVDYTTSGNATNAGSYTITVTGINAYKGTVSKSFTINKASQSFTVTASKPSLTNGESGKLTVSNYRGNLSYTSSNPSVVSVDASGNYKAEGVGSATITVTASGDSNYASTSKTVTVAVGKINLSDTVITSAYTSGDFNPTAEYRQPRITVTYNGTVLTKNTDYTVAYEAKSVNRTAGKHRYQVTGIGNFEGTYTGYYTINPLPITDSHITMAIADSLYQYDGYPQYAAPRLIYTDDKGVTASLVETADYTVTYANNVNVGTATVTITGKGDYKGSRSMNFTITKEGSTQTTPTYTDTIDFDRCNITVTVKNTRFAYDGKAKTPDVVVEVNGKKLVKGTDYTLSYKNNINPGTATVTIKGIGNYTGTKSYQFSIVDDPWAGMWDDEEVKPQPVKKSNNTITAANVTKTYATKAQTFAIGAKCNGGAKLTYSSDSKSVTVNSSGKVTIKAKFIGKATITVKSAATNSYNAATKKITVTCNPTKTALSTVSSKKKGQMVVKWKKNTVGSGYQVQYSTDKSFKKGVTTKTISKNKTVSATYSKLSGGKAYYVRIRTYKKVSGVNYYSAWSALKTVKIKK